MNHEMMPGMLTDEQMKQLDAARNGEFERLFLTFMIQHHQGAIAMVDKLLATREDIFDGYTRAGFEAAFGRRYETIEAHPIPESARTLYLLRRKQA